MNFVYKKDSLTPLTSKQLLDAVIEVCPFPEAYSTKDFEGENDRVQKLTCDCKGNAEFELMEPQKNEFRRHVRCRVCGKTMAM